MRERQSPCPVCGASEIEVQNISQPMPLYVLDCKLQRVQCQGQPMTPDEAAMFRAAAALAQAVKPAGTEQADPVLAELREIKQALLRDSLPVRGV